MERTNTSTQGHQHQHQMTTLELKYSNRINDQIVKSLKRENLFYKKIPEDQLLVLCATLLVPNGKHIR
jgi:hypothetical protein